MRVELPEADHFLAVTMTTEHTVLLTVGELRELVGRSAASMDQLVSLVEDTDVHHAAIAAWLRSHEGQTYVSFTARPT